MAQNIDVKNKRILSELDNSPNISLSQLAKKCKISPQVCEYRLKHLVEEKIIYRFYTLIDAGKLGFTSFRIHIKLKNISEENYTKFAKHLFENYPTFWIGFVSGNFDIIADIFAKNPNEFELLLSRIIEENKQFIYSYEIMPILEMNLYQYGYFIDRKITKKGIILHKIDSLIVIDSKDIAILKEIKNNSRLTYEHIGRKVGLTRNAVKYRINAMEKNKVIAGYKIFVDYKSFDKTSWKIFVKYDNSKIDQEKMLLAYLKEFDGVLATTKHLGRWNIDIEMQIRDARELQKFIITLRNKFSIIEQYEIVQLLEDYGIDFFPDSLKVK